MSSALIAGLRRPIELRSALLGAWRWWFGYFQAAVGYATPKGLREQVLHIDISARSERNEVDIRFGAQNFALPLVADEADLAPYRQQIAEAARDRRADRVLGTLHLPPDCCVQKRISLPAAARDAVMEAAGYQLELDTPFRSSEVYFGARIVGQTATVMSLDLALAPKRIVDSHLAYAGRLGTTIRSVLAEYGDDGSDAIELAVAGPNARSRFRLAPTFLAGGIALALLAAAGAPLVAKIVEVDALAATAASDMAIAQPIVAAHRKLTADIIQQQAIAKAIESYPEPLNALAELTGSIPKDSWLTRLAIRSGEIQITGLTPSTSSLIDTLTKTGLFYPPTYAAPTMTDAQYGIERFVLNIRPRPAL